ncbi:MAG: MBL fold metallo-hydrolase [Acidobacteria bacterium]|nr:MBL fold metallo-hydrolase [Acidobacteriota bacterium]
MHRLAPDVYYWSGDLSTHEQTNVGFVVFRDYVLVIDANFPWAAEKIIADIQAITPKPVRFVFNTHYHADHTLGNSVFVAHGATIVSTDDLALELSAKGMEDVRDQTKINWKHLELPSIRFQDRLVFDDGQHRVELIKYGQAHTKGDAVAYLPAEGIVFVGDLAVNWTHGNNLSDQDVSYVGWIRALDNLAQLPIKTVVPAHGDLGDVDLLRRQRDFIADMWKQVKQGLKAGKSSAELRKTVQLTQHGIFAADRQETEDTIESMCDRARGQADWNSGDGKPE